MTAYIQTVPFYVCQATYGQCVAAHPNDLDGQDACKAAAVCGTKNATALASTTTSTTAASTTTMATSTGTSSTTTTSAAAASTTTHNAAAALSGVNEHYATGLMATLMFLAMRLVL